MKKYGIVTVGHGGFKIGTILELLEVQRLGKSWQCVVYRGKTCFDKGAKLYCTNERIRIVTKEDNPEEFL